MKESIPQSWRLIGARYRLEGKKCETCNKIYFPPRDLCNECGKETVGPTLLSGKGELLSYTTVYDAPSNMELEVPYDIGIIKLDEGPSVTGIITGIDPENVKIGMRVERAFRKLGKQPGTSVIVYGYKFFPESYPK